MKKARFIHYLHSHYTSCVIIALVSTGLLVLPFTLTEQLTLSEVGITQGQLWRLVTGHFVHTNSWHYLLNITGLALTWFLFAEHLRHMRVLGAVIVNTVGLSLVLWWFDGLADIAWYAGLSGTLHGLFAFALVLELQRPRISTFALIALGIGKLLFEQLGGSTDSTAALINASVAIHAHLFGAVLGTIYGFVILGISYLENRSTKRK